MSVSASADRTNTQPEDESSQPAEAPRTGRLTVAALRRAIPLRLWGGKGCGVPCDFCRVLVSSSEVEYEVEAELDGERITLHFHHRCHDVWKSESEAPPGA